jgi:hypothetical protein
MSELKVNKVTPRSGTTVTLGDSGDTITIPSGATFSNSGTVTGITQGITMADQWRLTADTNTSTNADVTTNWERNDSSGYSSIGTGLTESSGIFSFPSTGIYLILFTGSFVVGEEDTFVQFIFKTTLNNSSYTAVSEASSGNDAVGQAISSGSGEFIFDVTSTINNKFKFSTADFGTNTKLKGDTAFNETHFTVIRLGDT